MLASYFQSLEEEDGIQSRPQLLQRNPTHGEISKVNAIGFLMGARSNETLKRDSQVTNLHHCEMMGRFLKSAESSR